MRALLDPIFDWPTFGFGVPILISVGFGLLADEFKAFKAARICFYISAAWICGKVLMWSVFSSERFLLRATVIFVVFGVVGVGLSEVLRLTTTRETSGTNPAPVVKPEETTPVKTPSGPETEKPPTLSDLFKRDFPNTMKATDDLQLKRQMDDSIVHIKRQVYLDFSAKAQFVGFYVPSSDPFSDETFKICKALVDAVQPAIEELAKRVEIRGGYKGEDTTVKDLTFSGRVFLYHEGFLSIPQKADLINSYKAKNYDVQFRGIDYLQDQLIGWHHQHDPKPGAAAPPKAQPQPPPTATHTPIAKDSFNPSFAQTGPTIEPVLAKDAPSKVPDIEVEIGEVHIIDSAHVFLRVRLHNRSQQVSTVKSYRLVLTIDGAPHESEEVLSCEGYVMRRNVGQGMVIYGTPEPLSDLQTVITPSSPLQRGIPRDGWLHFFVRGYLRLIDGVTNVELVVVDPFGTRHRGGAKPPWEKLGRVSYRPDLESFLGVDDAIPPVA